MSVSTARIILDQLGASKFVAMTGAKDFVSSDNALSFRIGRNASKANKVRITLQSNDLYRVEFFRVRGLDCDTVSVHSDIQAETLAKFVGSVFGMAVSL